MIEFFNKIFGRQASGATAKERLRLVLMSDHLSLAPDMIEAMKRDLVDVISKYVEVDREKIDVHFEHEDRGLAMLANIPITGVNRNGGNGSGGNGHSEDAEPVTTHDEHHAETVEAHAATGDASTEPRRRRKRRKGGQHHGGAPQTGSPAPAT
ncbi:MAG TPA: cell division topological specificity factor MinE [Candidatus Baltobacteraceae bacterium]|nr:cell division topological specificity factor MinE [Candidatus Baltobacteraceae bacterium]